MGDTATTDQEYYENPENWGNSQYVSLKNILDNILITADDDSYFKHISRFRARIFAKQGLKHINLDIKANNKAIAIDVPPSRIFPFPRYMTNWSRVSVLNECQKLEELNINNRPSINDYLQDNDAELLYDCNGDILEGDSFNADDGTCTKFEIQPCCEDSIPNCGCGCDGEESPFEDSWVKENQDGNYFEFSEDLEDQTVVIEYQSAGLEDIDDCDIKIDNRLELTITYWTQWKLLEGKRNVPKSEVIYYKEEYRKYKKKSEILLGSKISISQIIKAVSLR